MFILLTAEVLTNNEVLHIIVIMYHVAILLAILSSDGFDLLSNSGSQFYGILLIPNLDQCLSNLPKD